MAKHNNVLKFFEGKPSKIIVPKYKTLKWLFLNRAFLCIFNKNLKNFRPKIVFAH